MIIHNTEIITDGEYATAWSKIELEKPQDNFPEYLWYRVPNQYADYLTAQSDAFLVAGLLAGMYFGEDIFVKGIVSPRLAYHLTEYQYILNFRFPEYLRQVNIVYDRIQPSSRHPTGVGTTFSGGVDSLYTLWKHLPQNQTNPDYQVSHALFIKGFDILHREKENYLLLYDRYVKQLKKIGVVLVPLETNTLGVLHMRMPLSYLFGPIIVAAGIALAGLHRVFYVPSSWDYSCLKKRSHASDPLVDGLLSTDELSIIHHGAMQRRVDKVEEIADWELAQNVLWVCLEAKFEPQKWNCSRCEKCVRTMIPLYALGKLDRYPTFTKPFTRDWEGLWWARKFQSEARFCR